MPWWMMARMRRRIFLWLAVALGGGIAIGWRLNEQPRWWWIAIGLFLLSLISGAIAFRLTRPLIMVVKAARDIGDGKLDTRLDVDRHGGETRVLASAINDMAEKIEQQIADQRQLLAAVSHELRTPLGHMRVLVETARGATPSGDASVARGAPSANADGTTAGASTFGASAASATPTGASAASATPTGASAASATPTGASAASASEASVGLANNAAVATKALAEIEREILVLDDLVGKLLAQSRLEFGNLERRPIELGELVTDAATSAGVAPEAIEAIGSVRAAVDPTLVRRAIANLLDNARVHGRGVVAVRVERRAGQIAIEVDDAGPGVAPDRRAEAFRAFGPSTGGGGLGLGLALVSRIAVAHGGGAWIEDRPGGGARVGFAVQA
jgi:signal transduction histidine kinase